MTTNEIRLLRGFAFFSLFLPLALDPLRTRVKFSQLPFISRGQRQRQETTRAAFTDLCSSEHLVASRRAFARESAERRRLSDIDILNHSNHAQYIPSCSRVQQSQPVRTRVTPHRTMGLGKWTSFGTSSPDQLDLFCFLNTYRCSGAKPFYSCVFHHP